MQSSGVTLAQNERDYRVALRTEMLALRADGMPASMVGDVARGTPNVAELKLRRDCSEAVYKASQEAINVHKLQLRIIDAQINREWQG